MLTIGSLFAGIGGFDLGFERAGFKTVWQVEINEYCRKVLAKHFPDAERYADIRERGAHNLKPVDVICGGFPCQDISNAGLRAGIDGERSGLWREMHRVISELRPRYVVVENVAALLGWGMGRVLGDLAEIGYDAEWDCIPASAVGAQHERDRIWIIAYAHGARELQPEGRQQHERRRFSNRITQNASHADSSRCEGRMQAGANGTNERDVIAGLGLTLDDAPRISRDYWDYQPVLGGRLHGVPNRLDRIGALGNAVVPQIPELIARRLKEVLIAER